MSENFRMDPMQTASRSPFRDNTNRPSIFCAAAQLEKLASRPTITGQDIMKSRIEQLEREKVDLALQLHIREEKDRAHAQTIEQIEANVSHERERNKALEDAIETHKSIYNGLVQERDQLESEVRRLTRQQETTNDTSSLWQKMTAASRELRRVEDDCRAAQQENAELVQTNSKFLVQLEAMKEKLAMYECNEEKTRAEQSRAEQSIFKLEVLEKEHHAMSEQLTAAEVAKHEIIEKFSKEMEKIIIEKKLLAEELRTLKSDAAREKAARLKAFENSESSDVIFTGDDGFSGDVISMLRKKLTQSETKRRQLHNQLQELRGNVRVYVRCRPFLRCDGDEAVAGQASLTFHPEGTSVSVAVPGRTGQSFNFDHVFSMGSSQEEVYSNIEDLVQSALDGYRVCIFSYGQTGSGKTHTMTGDHTDEGIIPRSVRQILSNAIELQNNAGWKISLEASIVELYNEDVRDLLCPAAASSAVAGSDKDKLKISIMQGRVNVSGLVYSEIELTDTESGMMKLNKLLQDAAKSRTVACTGMNEHSSRSHVLFMLDITCTHGTNGTVLHGGLKLVDLAGSERLNRTGTLNDAVRLKETVNINKSLSSLSDVFTALANKASHVPYRNSKLTMLLQDCLSGDGKALMFVNVSPTVASSQETLCSLRFANQVSQVELGKARKNVTQFTPAQIIPPLPPMAAQAPLLQSSSQEITSCSTSTQQPAVSVVSSNSQFSRRSSMSFNPVRNASVSLATSKEVTMKSEVMGSSALSGSIIQEASICKSARLSVLTGAKRMISQATTVTTMSGNTSSSSTMSISQQAVAKKPKTGCWR